MYSNKTDLQEVMLHMKIVSVDIFLLAVRPGGGPLSAGLIRMKGCPVTARRQSGLIPGRLPRIV